MAITFDHPYSFITIFLFFCLIPITFSNPLSDDSDHPMTFIVHMAKQHKPLLFTSQFHWYNSIIKSLPHSRHPSRLLYTYERVANGFAVSLTPSQAAELENIPGVLSVMPDEAQELHITHTYRFLGLSSDSGLWPSSNYGEDIIIGILDTGIWPEHRSFSDAGLSPVPSSWKGTCETWNDFPATSCNRKIIGARSFLAGHYMSNLVGSTLNLSAITNSPRDTDGHGTHTTSTAAGSVVSNASFYKFAKGKAIGIATKARVAVYKVCATRKVCRVADILAGMDQAVADGVDIISMSISGGTKPYHQDNIAIATFGAMKNGILVSASGGNKGPTRSTVNHLPPWVLTVGASSVDREFVASVILGTGRPYAGTSLYPGPRFPFLSRYELVHGGDFGNPFCKVGEFNKQDQLVDKIIVCEQDWDTSSRDSAYAVANVSGRGAIIVNNRKHGEELLAEPHRWPATRVAMSDGYKIMKYLRSENPTATINFYGTWIAGEYPITAPEVASFSSRGPNPLTPQILKPDVIAPGLNILAAWSNAIGPWGDDDPRRVEFNIISGTSMACAHVSGISALLKKVYPTWSPAAIKSALMTTAYDLDNDGQRLRDLAGKRSTPFAHGSGHVDPSRALDPGLIYDMNVTDYVGFLCSIGYDSTLISKFFTETISSNICEETYAALGGRVTPGDLNVPSFSAVFENGVETVKYRRTVTNVGTNVDAVYSATAVAPEGTKITISPNRLVFDANNPTQTYEITFSSTGGNRDKLATFGWIQWSDGIHSVRSTIACSWVRTTTDYVASM
ncbi:Subtilisin-like protease [Morus notabilis]|uniref:Subtilisin-like protease n=1 Tax=Morus notabilis TaxID=981085 RepID=W9QNW2_9ROSA|nr:subtilisin-like protease SBT1.4 [Morus notabilis]EXB36979.1 Subtilisin-like protease [Morus notabilis]